MTGLPEDWTVRARNADLTEGEFIEGFESLTLVELVNQPGALQLVGPLDELRPLLPRDGGVIVSDGTGRRFTGPLTSRTRNGDDTAALTFHDDLIWLWGRKILPTPSQPVTAQTTDVSHVLSGPAETVLLAYIAANAGPTALPARRVPHLVVPTSLGRGGTVERTARLDTLGQLIAEIANAADLRVTVQQTGTTLAVVVTPMPDLTGIARYGTADAGGPGVIDTGWSWTEDAPDVTAAIVCGAGTGTAKVFRERIDAAAQAAWGRRVEGIVDQSQTAVVAELDQAGDEALRAGSQPVAITAPILDDPDLRLGVDVPLSALTLLDLDGDQVTERLRKLTTTITAAGVEVEGVVSSTDGTLTRSQREFRAIRETTRKAATR